MHDKEFTDAQVLAFIKQNPVVTKGMSLDEVRALLARISINPPPPKSSGKVSKAPKSKPMMKKGGLYKGKSHAYATGGLVKDLQIMRKK